MLNSYHFNLANMRIFTTRNVGNIDRIIRCLPAFIVAYFYIKDAISGWFGIVLIVLAGMLLITSITGSCSIYYFLNLSTCLRKK